MSCPCRLPIWFFIKHEMKFAIACLSDSFLIVPGTRQMVSTLNFFACMAKHLVNW